jgi:hypothetical protein
VNVPPSKCTRNVKIICKRCDPFNVKNTDVQPDKIPVSNSEIPVFKIPVSENPVFNSEITVSKIPDSNYEIPVSDSKIPSVTESFLRPIGFKSTDNIIPATAKKQYKQSTLKVVKATP